MISIDPALLRLKEQLGVSTDKEVAAVLGLGEKAFNARKKRGAFPEDKLLALTTKRPELGLDVAYILTGERAVVHALMGAVRAAAQIAERLGGTREERQARADVLMRDAVQAGRSSLSDEEQVLLGCWRAAEQSARDDALRALLRGKAAPEPAAPPEQPAPVTTKIKKQKNYNAPFGQAAGKIINKGS